MKAKTSLTIIGILPFVIACNSKSIAGTYGFQLGKVNGTHFGLFLELTDKPYEGNSEFKNMYLSYNIAMGGSDDGDMMSGLFEDISALFKNEDDQVSIPGYYKLTDDMTKNREKLLKVGIGFDYFYDRFKKYYKESTNEDLSDDAKASFEKLNNNELIESIVYVTYQSGVVNVNVPVSFEDIYYQIYWYGFDIQITIDEETLFPFVDIVEVEKHQFGSHPTKEQVAAINEHFKENHEGLFFTSYRDYHALKLGLNKQ